MCGSDELIHDARQVDLEEMIMTKDVQYYLVPGRLTDEQRQAFVEAMDCGEPVEAAIAAIGTPIQPCADVETVGWLDPALLDALHVSRDTLLGVTLANIETPTRNIPLVRRTDMEAQVARVAAEKDAEIAATKALLRPILTRLDYAAHELEQTEHAQSVHQLAHICLSLLSDEESIRQSAFAELAALNEGAAG